MNVNKKLRYTIFLMVMTFLFVIHVLPVVLWTNETLSIVYVFVVIGLAIALYYVLYSRSKAQEKKRENNFLSSKIKTSYIIMFCLLACSLEYVLTHFYTSIFEVRGKDGQDDFRSIISSVFQAPIMEEIIWRGLLFLFLIKICRKINVGFCFLFVLLSSFTFSLAHVIDWGVLINTMEIKINCTRVIPHLISGLLFSLLYLITRSLLSSILVHMVNNAIYKLTDVFINTDSLNESVSWFLFIASIVVIIVTTSKLFYMLQKDRLGEIKRIDYENQ